MTTRGRGVSLRQPSTDVNLLLRLDLSSNGTNKFSVCERTATDVVPYHFTEKLFRASSGDPCGHRLIGGCGWSCPCTTSLIDGDHVARNKEVFGTSLMAARQVALVRQVLHILYAPHSPFCHLLALHAYWGETSNIIPTFRTLKIIVLLTVQNHMNHSIPMQYLTDELVPRRIEPTLMYW